VRAKEQEEAEKLLHDALLLQKAGVFAIVLEKVPAKLAQKVTASVQVPVIGIGAGAHTDGQVLVVHDMLGMTQDFSPRFLRRYLNLSAQITTAVSQYVQDVKAQHFPNEKESY
jgi:3-methyl-2-oxobutanoate hydroxymethyltransferase